MKKSMSYLVLSVVGAALVLAVGFTAQAGPSKDLPAKGSCAGMSGCAAAKMGACSGAVMKGCPEGSMKGAAQEATGPVKVQF